MRDAIFILAVLACPLGMLAMGAVAWVSGKAFGDRPRSSSKDPVPEKQHVGFAEEV
jgi:hypothetical protein